MLTALHLEGFKTIGTRQRIELAPLTLLVGCEGVGKGIVLEALIYLRQLLESGRADSGRTAVGGERVEIGGFERLVFARDLTRAIVLKAEFTTPGGLAGGLGGGPGEPFPDLEDEIEAAWIELTVRMQSASGRCEIDRVDIGTTHHPEPLVRLEGGPSLREDEPLRAHVDLRHPLLHEAVDADESLRRAWATLAVPSAGSPSCPTFSIERTRGGAWPSLHEPLRVLPPTTGPVSERALGELQRFLASIVQGIGSQLAQALRSMLYVSSFRTAPPQGFLDEHEGRASSWAHGLAAWDHLLADRSALVARTNHWLGRLGTGCRVAVQSLVDPTARSLLGPCPVLRRLRLHGNAGPPLLPSEVGAGLCQLLPVVVAALEAPRGISLFEEPELHVHPANQLGLGDLFIEAATRDTGGRVLLVETRSEHLVLRTLRRIRQAANGERPTGSTRFSPDALSLLHATEGPEGLRLQRIRVDEDGALRDRWPGGFFEERTAEAW